MAQRDYKTGYTFDQFLYCVKQSADAKTHDAAEGEDDPTTGGLIWRINGLKNSNVFSNVENLELKELFKPGQCTVLQLNEVPQREQQVIAAVILLALLIILVLLVLVTLLGTWRILQMRARQRVA